MDIIEKRINELNKKNTLNINDDNNNDFELDDLLDEKIENDIHINNNGFYSKNKNELIQENIFGIKNNRYNISTYEEKNFKDIFENSSEYLFKFISKTY